MSDQNNINESEIVEGIADIAIDDGVEDGEVGVGVEDEDNAIVEYEVTEEEYEKQYALAEMQLMMMAESGEITVNSEELVTMLILLLRNLKKDENLYQESRQLIPLLKKGNPSKDPTDRLLLLFSVHQPFSYIVPTLRYQLGFSVQNDKECIMHLKNLKRMLMEKNKEVDFIDRLIDFLTETNVGTEYDSSDLIKLNLELMGLPSSNDKTKFQDCAEYIEAISD